MKHKGRLQKQNEDGSIDPHQAWLVNNMVLWTDDNWKTSRTGIGEFKIEGKEFYGLIAEAVFAGYIEGSRIYASDMEGGTIRIGKYYDELGDYQEEDGRRYSYAFEVHEDGSVTMGGGGTSSSIGGYVKEDDYNKEIEDIKGQIKDIEAPSANMYRVEITSEGSTVISTVEDKITLYCRVYSWDSDITQNLIDSGVMFYWKRVSNDPEEDDEWNNTFGLQGGNSITIDADDVIENSSFYCEVDLPE